MTRTVPPPELLYYAESSLFGGLRYLRFEDGVMTCCLGHGVEGHGERAARIPALLWQRLWDLLEELEAWDWSGYYGNLTALDGLSWALDLSWEGRVLEASGYQSWPGKPRQFQRLMALLEEAGAPEPAGWLAGALGL
jgi:hypothetical protein